MPEYSIGLDQGGTNLRAAGIGIGIVRNSNNLARLEGFPIKNVKPLPNGRGSVTTAVACWSGNVTEPDPEGIR